MLTKIERITDKIIDIFGAITGFLLIVMILNVAYDVFARYLFHNSSIGMQEFEWHLFSVIILYGTGYALRENSHVRVDFLYDSLSPKKQAFINIFGTIFFMMPLIALIVYGSYEFVYDAFETGEISEDPGGLPYRWLIKAQIPFAFIFLFLSAINFLVRNINIYKGKEKPTHTEVLS